jgi:hypothetical protein
MRQDASATPRGEAGTSAAGLVGGLLTLVLTGLTGVLLKNRSRRS